jgi:hypothetical protein
VTFPIAFWNDTVGTAVNVTIEGVFVGSTMPNNDQVWIDVDYFGSSSSPIASTVSGSKANNAATPTPLTASTADWDSAAPARTNSTAYTAGDPIAVASNPGRIFFCTTAGTTASSEPAGYATAVDGDTITDGTAMFVAGMRFKQTVTVTPQAKGFITANVKYGYSTASQCYIDPKVTN